MYQVFELPHDFLDRDYTESETAEFDQKLWDAIHGPELTEELTDKQKKKVASWDNWQDAAVKREHNRVFGEKIDRIILPYDDSGDDKLTTKNFRQWNSGRNPGKNEHHETVLAHMEEAGYHTDDYMSGLFYHKDKPERKMKATKAMNLAGIADKEFPQHRTVAQYDDHGMIVHAGKAKTLQQVYETDPLRAASKSQKQIVITRNKYDVAGMSTGRGWSSCMNMVDGCNKHYLPHDIQQGTLTAYLTHKGDDGVTKPIGRINLKRFDSSDHTIFRPENSAYGTTPKGFKQAVHDWANNNYESKPGIYLKHASLYNDDGKNVKFEKVEQIAPSEYSSQAQKAAHRILRSYEDQNPDKDGWDMGDADHIPHDAYSAASSILQHMSPKDHAKEIVHQISDHSSDHDGDNQEVEDTAFSHAYHPSEIHGSDVMHHWGIQQMATRQGSDKFVEGLKELSHDELLHQVEKVHKAMKGSEENGHTTLKEVYAGLTNEAFKRDVPHIHAEILHHMTDSTNSEFHGDMMQHHQTIFDKHHPIELTHDPRMMHHILNSDTSHFTQSEAWNHDTMYHVGKYADHKLAHDVIHASSIDDNSRRGFIKGLNENPHGEKIQHHLINDMLLIGGENRSRGAIRDIHNKHDLGQAQMGYHRGYPGSLGFNSDHSDDEYDHVEKFADIANYTKFPSVYGRIKKRAEPGGDLDVESIKDGIKYNTKLKEQFEIDTNDKRRFRDFMKLIG